MFAGDQARVFSVERGAWTEVKPGRFAARCLGPSAVVEAIDTEEDSDGPWFETWVLAVTARERHELLVRWIRMVNNVRTPLNEPNSRFSFEGVGTLRGVPTAEGCTARTVDALRSREFGSITIGDFLECGCARGEAYLCAALSQVLEREGGKANLTRAKELRQKACDLGLQLACSSAK